MPLTDNLSSNIKELIKSGRSQKQAVAIALDHQRRSKKKGMEHVHMALKKMEEMKMPRLHSPRSQMFFASRKIGK